MKKKLLSLAVAAVAFTSMAFAQNANTTDGPKTENTNGQKALCPAFNPFEGISLSADQQTKIDALKAERKQKSETARAERQKKNEERLNARREARRAELNRIKSILTPEQYVQYLENITIAGNGHYKAGNAHRSRGKHTGKMARNDNRKGDKKAKRGNRGNGASATTATNS